MNISHFARSLLLIQVASCCVSASATTLYDLTDLGVINIGGQLSQDLKLDINDNQMVIGWDHQSINGLFYRKSFIWQGGVRSYLNPNIELNHTAFAVNNNGTIVGSEENPGNSIKPVSWQKDASLNWTMSYLPINRVGGIAKDISNGGTVVGHSIDSTDKTFASQWDSITSPQQDILPGVESYAMAIVGNAIIGSRNASTDKLFHSASGEGFLWNGGVVSTLGSIRANSNSSVPTAINSLNTIVGGAHTDDIYSCFRQNCFSAMHGFIWQSTQGMQDLLVENSNSWANDINDAGLVVGSRRIGIDGRAVLWEQNVAFDLNLLLNGVSNWKLENAHAINQNGQIVGIGTVDNQLHGFLLTPTSLTVLAADLELAQIGGSGTQKLRSKSGDSNSVSLRIVNHGPDTATNIRLNGSIDSGVNISGFTIPNGSCSTSSASISCDIDTLEKDGVIDLSIQFSVTQGALYSLTAEIDSDATDTGLSANNKLSTKIKLAPFADTTNTTPVTNGSVDTTSSDGGTSESNTADTQSPNASEQTDTPTEHRSIFGCSLAIGNTFDPSFLLLAGIAFIYLTRKRRSTSIH